MKLDNTIVDGINQKPSGYMILMTAGDRTFVAAEGEIGRSMIEIKKKGIPLSRWNQNPNRFKIGLTHI